MHCKLTGFIATTLFLASSAAQAICAIPSAKYEGGDFGAEAVASKGCFNSVVNGGNGSTFAAVTDAPVTGVRSSANIQTGVMTAYSDNGFASSAMWDTLTFSGLPSIGASLTETLFLTGSMTGDASGSITLRAGRPSDSSALSQSWSLSAGNVPASVSITFEAHNGVPVMIFGSMLASGSPGNIADLLDPPTLAISTPGGVTYTSASGQFSNVSPVPEPATYALLLSGLALMTFARRRRQS